MKSQMIRDRISHLFGQINSHRGQIGEWFLAFGLGGVIAFRLLCHPKLQLNTLFSNLDEFLAQTGYANHDISETSVTILCVAIPLLIISPLLIFKLQKNKKIPLLLFASVIYAVIFGITVTTAKTRIVFELATWLLVAHIISLVIDLLKGIYRWLQISNSSPKTFDIAKLTFIWAILAFLFERIS